MAAFEDRFKKFAADRRGSVGVVFGMVGFAMFAATGGAVSYSYLTETRTNHQNALDAAVLSAVLLPDETTEFQRIAVATSTYYANIGYVAARSAADLEKPNFVVSSTKVVGSFAAGVRNPFPLFGGNASRYP